MEIRVNQWLTTFPFYFHLLLGTFDLLLSYRSEPLNESATVPSRHRTIIKPSSGWISIRWAELWQYRSLLWVFTWRDIKVRYKQTLLGFTWAVIGPVMSMIVFTVIFGKLAGFDKLTGDTPYQLVVFAGLLPWSYFSGSLGRAGNSLVSNAHIITKVYFPRLMVPVSTLGSGVVDFAIALVVFFCLAAYYGIYPSLPMLLIPLLLLGVSALAVGIGMIFSAVIVKFRDFGMVMSYMITFWMYLTPVMYPAEVLSEKSRWLLDFNPMHGYVSAFRTVLLDQPMQWVSLGYSLAFTAVFLIIGAYVFTRAEKTFADVV